MEKVSNNDNALTSSQTNNSKDHSGKEKKYQFYRKPSIKKKVPEVKQTKTSMKRFLIANPLLKYDINEIDNLRQDIAAHTDPKLNHHLSTTNKDTSKNQKTRDVKSRGRQGSIIIGNLSEDMGVGPRVSTSKQGLVDYDTYKKNKFPSSTPLKSNRPNKLEQNKKKDLRVNEQKPLRRSISAHHFNRKRGL